MMTAHIYIKPYDFKRMTWDNSYEIPFTEYSIDETDYRNKTAKFKTDRIYDVSSRSYAVKITNPHHETFTGIILRRDTRPQEVFEYSCQDWNKLYMAKPVWDSKKPVHTQIKSLLKYCGQRTGGLLSKNKYNQRKYGHTSNFNPMKKKKTVSTSDKTVKEIIQNLVYEQQPLIDIHYNNTGTMQFTPYYKNKWMQSTADFHYTEATDFNYELDTTNIINKVNVNGKTYGFKKLFNSTNDPLSSLILTQANEDNGNNSSSSSSSSKDSKTNDKTGNVYGTKTKNVWVTMDQCWGSNGDHKYYNKFVKEAKKLGWKIHKRKIGPGGIIPGSLPSDTRNGIWLLLCNGVDCEVFRHIGHDKFFKGMLLKRNCRAVIGLINHAGNIKKGGKYYNYLGMAHDGTGKGNPGLKHPAGYLADCGVPFFYSDGNNPKDAARRFNSGGDSKIALDNDYTKRLKPYYNNWNWSSKY